MTHCSPKRKAWPGDDVIEQRPARPTVARAATDRGRAKWSGIADMLRAVAENVARSAHASNVATLQRHAEREGIRGNAFASRAPDAHLWAALDLLRAVDDSDRALLFELHVEYKPASLADGRVRAARRAASVARDRGLTADELLAERHGVTVDAMAERRRRVESDLRKRAKRVDLGDDVRPRWLIDR